MTHDELLVKLMVLDVDESEQTRLSKTTQALRAVVELHKPILTKYMEPDVDRYECQVCREEPYYSRNAPYPCTTIQAIEKELG
jgi:hypothetical protein